MTTIQMIEIAIAAVLIVAGIRLQVRSKRVDAKHGSQGAVILLAIGAILAIHGFGLLEYRPAGSGL